MCCWRWPHSRCWWLSVPRLRTPALRIAREIKESRIAYLLIAPSMLLIMVFAYVPTVMGLYYSFTNFNLAEPIKFIGLENFVKVLTKDQFFWVGVGNMLLLLVTGDHQVDDDPSVGGRVGVLAALDAR